MTTLIHEPDLDTIKMNQHVEEKVKGQFVRQLSCEHTHTHTHTQSRLTAQPGPQNGQ